jgi:hypothetical protein
MVGVVPDGARVDVYWNLNKDVFSVRSRERDSYGRVIAHVRQVNLSDVTFVVSEAGRQRVLRNRRKNVHAFMRGTWSSSPVPADVPLSYNPYTGATFVSEGLPVFEAQGVRGEVVGSGDSVRPSVMLSTDKTR